MKLDKKIRNNIIKEINGISIIVGYHKFNNITFTLSNMICKNIWVSLERINFNLNDIR